jgi:hypothetical protein
MIPTSDSIRAIAIGYTETALLTTSGLLYTAGAAGYRGDPIASNLLTKINANGDLNDEAVEEVCAGFYWMLARTVTGRLVGAAVLTIF